MSTTRRRPRKRTSGENRPAIETPQAALAFEQFFALGNQRSLRRLAEQRVANELAQSDTVLTPEQHATRTNTTLRHLKDWSAAHNWQERVIERDCEHYAAIRAAVRKESIQALKQIHKDLILGLRMDVNRYLAQLVKAPPEGPPVIMSNAGDLRKCLDALQELTGVALGSIDDLDDDTPGANAAAITVAAQSPNGLRRALEQLIRRAAT